MRVILHDLTNEAFEALSCPLESDTVIVSDNGSIQPCIGCFGCWIKTPGVCVRKDGYGNMGEILSKCHELIIISKCVYGSYSPFIRNVLDRSIPFLLPYFVMRNGETHHAKRYDNEYRLSVFFYGTDLLPAEKETAESLVQANAVNFYVEVDQVEFYHSIEQLKDKLG